MIPAQRFMAVAALVFVLCAGTSCERKPTGRVRSPDKIDILIEEGMEAYREERNADALAAFQKALALTDKDDDPKRWTETALRAAQMHMTQAGWKEAEILLTEALRLCEQLYGPDTASFQAILIELTVVLKTLNRLSEAEPLLRRLLVLHENTFGKNSDNVASDLNDLVKVLTETGRFEEADRLRSRYFEIIISHAVAHYPWGPNIEKMTSEYRALRIKMGDTEAEAKEKVDKLLKEGSKK